MNCKRLTTTLAALLFCGTLAFGEIALKDLGNGQVEITFTFKDSSSEMGVIGSFDNWTAPGEAMTKNEAGLWEKTIQAGNADVITYKFYSKGTWIFDERAPDKKDDGYGGFNGLIPVADILAGVLPAVPGAAPLPPPKAGPKVAGRPKLSFGTETFIESSTTFLTATSEVRDSVINAKSLWKLQGDLIAGMPGFLEVTAFNGSPKLHAKNGIEIDEGLEALSAGFLFNPIYYLGGNKRPTLDKFRFGFDSPYLTYETGYGNTPLPLHKSVLWNTVSDPYIAGDGYSAFLLGPKAKSWGDFAIDAGLVPNKSLGGAYGLYGWASVDAYGVKLEGQYAMKSGTKTDASLYFTKPPRQDFLGAADLYWEGLVLRGQYLTSVFGEGISGADLPARERTAYKVVGGYVDSYGDLEVLVGYAFRGGVATQMLYLNPADTISVLGKAQTQSVSLTGFQKFGYWGVAKWEASRVSPLLESPETNVVLQLRPGFVLDFAKLDLFEAAVEVFAKMESNSDPAPGVEKLALVSAGAKVDTPWADLHYKFDNSVKSVLLNSLLSEVPLAKDLNALAGVALRTGSGAKQALGFVLGASTVLPVPEAKTPTAYVQMVYNLDPFNNDKSAGTPGYDLTDFGPTNGASAFDGLGALRFGLKWKY